jgi:tetratricopeptide (TPR) repeat protein
MVQIAMEKNDRARVISELEAVLQTSHTDLDSARLLAKQLELAGGSNAAPLARVYAQISALDPFDSANHSAFGRLKMKAGDPAGAAREFRAAIEAGSLDAAAAHCDLAESYIASGDKARAKKEAIAAMEVAPGYPRAQDLLLKLVP